MQTDSALTPPPAPPTPKSSGLYANSGCGLIGLALIISVLGGVLAIVLPWQMVWIAYTVSGVGIGIAFSCLVWICWHRSSLRSYSGPLLCGLLVFCFAVGSIFFEGVVFRLKQSWWPQPSLASTLQDAADRSAIASGVGLD